MHSRNRIYVAWSLLWGCGIDADCARGDAGLAVRWVLAQNGSVSDRISIQTASSGERGIFADEHLESGEELAQVPRSAIFSAPSACPNELKDWEWNPEIDALEEQDVVALCLHHVCRAIDAEGDDGEDVRGGEPQLRDLIVALPGRSAVEHLAISQAASVGDSAPWGPLASDVDNELTRLGRLQRVSANGAEVPGSPDDSIRMIWALAVAQSHAHVMPAGFFGTAVADFVPSLVPLIDILNHCPEPSVVIRSGLYDGARIVALRPIAKGEELCVTYGQSSRRSYLLQYGFVALDQPSVVALEVPMPVRPASRERLDSFRQRMGESLMSPFLLEVQCDSQTGTPTFLKALAYLRFAALTEEDQQDHWADGECSNGLEEEVDMLAEDFDSLPPGPRCMRWISVNNEKQAVDWLQASAQHAVDSMQQTPPVHSEAQQVVAAEIACAIEVVSNLKSASHKSEEL